MFPKPMTPTLGSAIVGTLAGRLAPVTVDLLLDARVELAEGPIWDGATLTWVDLIAGAVHRLSLDGVPGPSLELGRRVGCAVPCADGGLDARDRDGLRARARARRAACTPMPPTRS